MHSIYGGMLCGIPGGGGTPGGKRNLIAFSTIQKRDFIGGGWWMRDCGSANVYHMKDGKDVIISTNPGDRLRWRCHGSHD